MEGGGGVQRQSGVRSGGQPACMMPLMSEAYALLNKQCQAGRAGKP